jgi:hypothetical protein
LKNNCVFCILDVIARDSWLDLTAPLRNPDETGDGKLMEDELHPNFPDGLACKNRW